MEIKDLNKTVTIMVNNQPLEVALTFDINEDYDCLYDANRIPTPGTFCAYIVVTASAMGLEGFDSLGGCEIPCNNMFDSSKFENGVASILSDYKLVENAIEHLTDQITLEYTRLTQLAESFKKYASTKK